jgi:hypothetical protein
LEQSRDVELSLPFALRGVDSDNGGELLNHHLVKYLQVREKPVLLTCSRAYHKNERYDNPAAAGLISACAKALWDNCSTTFCRRTNSRRNGARAKSWCEFTARRKRRMRGCWRRWKSARKAKGIAGTARAIESVRVDAADGAGEKRNQRLPLACGLKEKIDLS